MENYKIKYNGYLSENKKSEKLVINIQGQIMLHAVREAQINRWRIIK